MGGLEACPGGLGRSRAPSNRQHFIAFRGELYHRMESQVNGRDSRSTPALVGEPVRRANTHSAKHRHPRVAALEPQLMSTWGRGITGAAARGTRHVAE